MKRIILLAFCVFVLWGCGGGGSGSDSPTYNITVDKSSISMESVWQPLAVPPQSLLVHFTGDKLTVNHAPNEPYPHWLHIQSEAVNPKEVKLTLYVPFTSLSPRNYSTTIRLTTSKSDGSFPVTKDIPINLSLHDSLALTLLSADNIIGGHVGGQVFSTPLRLTLETSALQWQASSSVEWLDIQPQNGTGPTTVTISGKPTLAGAGWHDGMVTFTSNDGSQSSTVNIKLALDVPRWWINQKGVAFSELGTTSALSRTIEIATSAGLNLATFSAQSDTGWLSTHVNGKHITLTANPNALTEGLHLAQVVVQRNDVAEEKIHKIPVGLYINRSVDLSERTFPIFIEDNTRGELYGSMRLDPVRPIIYAYSTELARLEGYNIYTGEKILTLASELHFWDVDDDGIRLVFREYRRSPVWPDPRLGWLDRFRRYDLNTNAWLNEEYNNVAGSADYFSILDGVKVSYLLGQVSNYSGTKTLYDFHASDPDFHPIKGGSGERLFAINPRNRLGELDPLKVYQPYVFELAGKASLQEIAFGEVMQGDGSIRIVSDDDGRVWNGLGWVNYSKTTGFGATGTMERPDCEWCDYQALAISPGSSGMVVWDGPQIGGPQNFSRYNSAGEILSSLSAPSEAPNINSEHSLLMSADGLRFIAVQDSKWSNTGQVYLYIGNR